MGSSSARVRQVIAPSHLGPAAHAHAQQTADAVDEPGEHRLLRLQRLAGNGAVAALVAASSRRSVQRRPEDEPEEQRPAAPVQSPLPNAPADAGPSPSGPEAVPNPTPDTSPAAIPGTTGPGATVPGTVSTPATTSEATPAAPAAAIGGSAKATAAAPATGPSFTRDAGLDLEAAAAPTKPTSGTFAADDKAALPGKEPEPDLTSLAADQPFWNDSAAKAFAEKLADTYASRGLKSGVKVDRAAKLAELQQDFDDVVKGFIFGRSGYALVWNSKAYDTRWAQLPSYLAGHLQKQRGEILKSLQAANNKLPKDSRQSKEDLDKALELRMQEERFEVFERLRHRVAVGSWGWMAERREKLDFDTIKQKPTGKFEKLAELLTTDEMRGVIRDLLIDKKKALSDADKEKAVTAAQAAKNAAAKKEKKQAEDLTDDEKASAIAKAEFDRVKLNKLDGVLKLALIRARTSKDEADLVLPTKADVKGWQASTQQVRIHKDLISLLKVLEAEFPKGFRAGTYAIEVEGDHASQGFQGRFKSLDMYPNGSTTTTQTPFGGAGFFDKAIAFEFGMAIDRAVAGKGTFQILYNDFLVARELNKVLQNGQVVNIDNVTADKGGATNLNWHGPLVTHFHVDFSI